MLQRHYYYQLNKINTEPAKPNSSVPLKTPLDFESECSTSFIIWKKKKKKELCIQYIYFENGGRKQKVVILSLQAWKITDSSEIGKGEKEERDCRCLRG